MSFLPAAQRPQGPVFHWHYSCVWRSNNKHQEDASLLVLLGSTACSEWTDKGSCTEVKRDRIEFKQATWTLEGPGNLYVFAEYRVTDLPIYIQLSYYFWFHNCLLKHDKFYGIGNLAWKLVYAILVTFIHSRILKQCKPPLQAVPQAGPSSTQEHGEPRCGAVRAGQNQDPALLLAIHSLKNFPDFSLSSQVPRCGSQSLLYLEIQSPNAKANPLKHLPLVPGNTLHCLICHPSLSTPR